MQLSTTADGQNLAPLEMAKALQQMTINKCRTKRKAVFQPSFFNKLCWFWGRISTKMWVFGTVELVRLPTMKVHHPRDNAVGEGSSSFLASLAEKRGQLMTEIPRLVWAVCFEFKTRLKTTLDHWGFSCSAFRGKVSWGRCNLPHADRTSHSSEVQHPLSYWREFLVVCLPAKVLKYQSNKSWSSEDTAEYFLWIPDNANCITSTTPNQSS